LVLVALMPQERAMIDWKKIKRRAETAALLSMMAAGYLAPGLIWSATHIATVAILT